MEDWFYNAFGFEEREWEETRNAFQLNLQDFTLTSKANGRSFSAGHFSTPSLKELRAEGVGLLGKFPGALKVTNVLGDVSRMHAMPENRYAVFQAASQFNCLEFVGPSVRPEDGIYGYVFDKTQGPACSIACGAGTVVRNYFARVNGSQRWTGQQQDNQIDNLADFSEGIGNKPNGRFFEVRGGYTLSDKTRLRHLNALLDQLDEDALLDLIRVGIQRDTQVTSHSWGHTDIDNPEHLVTQVFGSACSVAYSPGSAASWKPLAALILKASYEATLWAGLINAVNHQGEAGSNRVFLTSLGGGVFGNPFPWITDAMEAAFAKFSHTGLEIYINSFNSIESPTYLDFEKQYRGMGRSKRRYQPDSDSRGRGRRGRGRGNSGRGIGSDSGGLSPRKKTGRGGGGKQSPAKQPPVSRSQTSCYFHQHSKGGCRNGATCPDAHVTSFGGSAPQMGSMKKSIYTRRKSPPSPAVASPPGSGASPVVLGSEGAPLPLPPPVPKPAGAEPGPPNYAAAGSGNKSLKQTTMDQFFKPGGQGH